MKIVYLSHIFSPVGKIKVMIR